MVNEVSFIDAAVLVEGFCMEDDVELVMFKPVVKHLPVVIYLRALISNACTARNKNF